MNTIDGQSLFTFFFTIIDFNAILADFAKVCVKQQIVFYMQQKAKLIVTAVVDLCLFNFLLFRFLRTYSYFTKNLSARIIERANFLIYRNRYCLKVLDNIFVQSAYFKGVLIHLNLRFIKSYSFEPKKSYCSLNIILMRVRGFYCVIKRSLFELLQCKQENSSLDNNFQKALFEPIYFKK